MAIAERLSQAVEKAWRIEELEQANYAYTQMLGFVSHELKSPVASMVTDARLLADGYLGDMPPQQKDKLERLIRKGEYLLDLVREYLDLARVEGGELEAAPAPERPRTQRGGRRRDRTRAFASRDARHADRGRDSGRAEPGGLLRPGADAHRPHQPARQRDQVRPRGRRDPGDARSRDLTTGQARGAAHLGLERGRRASHPHSATASFAASRASTTPTRRAPRARASGCTTHGASCSCTTATSRPTRRRASGPGSPWRSPPRRSVRTSGRRAAE